MQGNRAKGMAGALGKSWAPPKVKKEGKQKAKRPLWKEEKKLELSSPNTVAEFW